MNNKDYDNENDNSSVIYTELNNHKFLFMGDAGIEVEKDLIKKYKLQEIDVLKVGHHGSKTSSSEEFINEINPKHSIISVNAPKTAIDCIDIVAKTLNSEFEKVLKSPYWVDYARKQGYIVEKPEEIINIFLNKKRQIEMANADIKKAHQILD